MVRSTRWQHGKRKISVCLVGFLKLSGLEDGHVLYFKRVRVASL